MYHEYVDSRLFVPVAALVLGCAATFAGSLDPPGPPAPTMKTLDEVEARTPIHQSDLPLTIAADGAYYLAESLVATQNGVDMITVTGADVSLDLNGFAIVGKSGVVAQDCIEIGPSVRSFALTNGTIRNCGQNGVNSDQSVDLSVRVEEVQAYDNGAGGIFLGGGAYGVISRCAARDKGGTGLLMSDGMVRESVAYSNGGNGIVVGAGIIHSCVARFNAVFNAIIPQGGQIIDTYAP